MFFETEIWHIRNEGECECGFPCGEGPLYRKRSVRKKISPKMFHVKQKRIRKNTENANALPKKSGSASEAAVPQDVKVNADSLKNTETQAPEAERPQTQNTNLEYPDDPRARLAEEFRSLL